MDSFNNLKNKLNEKFGNELIGEVEGEEDVIDMDFDEEPKKTSKPKKEKVVKERKQKPIKEPKERKPLFGGSKKTIKNKKKEDSGNMTLSALNIDLYADTDNLLSASDVNGVVFELQSPTGLNPRQVSKFCDEVAANIKKYSDLVESRNRDVKRLADELERLQVLIQEEQQKSQLTSFIAEQQDETTKLKNEVIDLKLENKELKTKLESIQNSRHDIVLPNVSQNKKSITPSIDLEEIENEFEEIKDPIKPIKKKSMNKSQINKKIINDDYDDGFDLENELSSFSKSTDIKDIGNDSDLFDSMLDQL